MDWVDWHFVAGMGAAVAAAGLGWLLTLGLLRALRRDESSYHTWHQRWGWPVLGLSCTVCKHQPT